MDIRVEEVTFTYPSGVQALKGVSLHIAAGETVAIIGENGAGKSTLARHLNGLLKPAAGRVLVGGWNTQEHSVAAMARRVGFAFQNPDDQLFASTVRADVAFGPENFGLDETAVAARVAASLAAVGLPEVADEHPYDLAQAQRKLVSLAATLAMETPVLLLDEPTSGQDSAGQARIGAIIAGRQAAGDTVIAITHDIDFAAAHFARVVVMSGGRILADGPAGDVLARADLLAQADVTPPQLIRLAAALGLNGAPTDVAAFIALLTNREAAS